MILIGIDDTDIIGSKDTSQLARAIVEDLHEDWDCLRIATHQLLDDQRIPSTAQNEAASILIQCRDEAAVDEDRLIILIHKIREKIKRWFVKGSDPGLCVCLVDKVGQEIVKFGYQCQFETVTQADALSLADNAEIHLEGLGGTNGGIIGALAAIGLASQGNDGTIVQIGNSKEEITGRQPVADITSLGIEVTNLDSEEVLQEGFVLFEKNLRPNLRENRMVLYVQKTETDSEEPAYKPVKLS